MTAGRYVVDTSALVKRIGVVTADEPEAPAFNAWLDQALHDNADLLAPTLIRYELGNVMATAARRGLDLPPGLRAQMLDHALLGFAFADPSGAAEYAPPLSYYDAAYLALAKETGAVLVTYDALLEKVAVEVGVAVAAPTL